MRRWASIFSFSRRLSRLLPCLAAAVLLTAPTAFGRLLQHGETENPYTGDSDSGVFQSKYYDAETGLIYFGQRFYAPALGCFLSRDPIQEKGGINLYGYGSGNPFEIDALGLDWFPKAFKVENGVPMVQVADFRWNFWQSKFDEKAGTAAWMPATGETLDYFDKGADGWGVKNATEMHAVNNAHAFADLELAYRQFEKVQEAQMVAFMALPAAAGGTGAFLTELAWNEAGLPSPKQAVGMLKGGLSLARNGARYLNPGNWTFATGRMYAGVPVPKFVGNAKTIPDNALVRIDAARFDKSIDELGIQQRFFADKKIWMTQYKYVKDVTDPEVFETMLYRQNLWPSTEGRFADGVTIRLLKNVDNDAVAAGMTNMRNGIPQWRVIRDIQPDDLEVIGRMK